MLAAELGPGRVRVNAIVAGGADTPMGRVLINSPQAEAAIAALYALKRIADPNEIARAALFLASDDASFVTGAAFPVEGGVSVNRS